MPGPAVMEAHRVLAKAEACIEARSQTWCPMTAPAAEEGGWGEWGPRYACRKLLEAGTRSSSWSYTAAACSVQAMVLMKAVQLHVLQSKHSTACAGHTAQQITLDACPCLPCSLHEHWGHTAWVHGLETCLRKRLETRR